MIQIYPNNEKIGRLGPIYLQVRPRYGSRFDSDHLCIPGRTADSGERPCDMARRDLTFHKEDDTKALPSFRIIASSEGRFIRGDYTFGVHRCIPGKTFLYFGLCLILQTSFHGVQCSRNAVVGLERPETEFDKRAPTCWKITTPSFNDCADGILLLGRSLETKYGNFFEVRFWTDYIIDCRVTAYVVSGPQMSDRHRPE